MKEDFTRCKARSWPHRLALVLLVYVRDVVSHLLECLDRLTFFRRKMTPLKLTNNPRPHDFKGSQAR